MNKTFIKLLFSLCLFISFSLKAQKVIESPVYNYSTAGEVEILKVELSDKDTRISFKASSFVGWQIKINSESYLTDNETESGRKYKLLSAEGIEIDKESWTPECGYQEYTLVFEPLKQGAETLDYIGGNADNSWKIYGIEVSGKANESKSFLPQELNGEWRTTDEYNEWKYGFYDSVAIVDMDFWDYDYLKKSGKGYEVGLKKGEEKKTVYLKKNKNGTAEIGDLKKGNPLYTTTKKEIFKHKDAEEKPFFRNENAVLRVYVDNFNPKFKNRTIDLNMNNHITHERIQMYITLNDNGTAELNIPLNNPQLIWGTYEQYYHKFYIEPGDTLLITLDRNEIIKNIWEPYKYSKENRQPSFMGSQADVNRDLHCMGDYKRHNPFSWFNDMESLSYEQFQERYIGYYNESIEYLNKSVNDKLISEKSKRIAKADVTGLIGYRIMDYIRNMKNNVAKAEDLKFLKNFDLNDIYLLTTEHFGSFVNRYEFIWDRDKAFAEIIYVKFMKDLISELDNKKIKYDLNYKDSIRVYSDLITNYNPNMTMEESEKFKKLNMAYASFVEKYEWIAMPLFEKVKDSVDNRLNGYIKRQENYYIDSLKLNKDLLYTLMFSRMVSSFGPDKEYYKEDLETLKQYVPNKDMTDQMDDFFDRKYNVIEYPESVAKDYFNSIIAPHKGKVVVIDFWATYCGPCISGIKKTADLRERLKGKDISFVFITDKESSPKHKYDEIMENVDGYKHYIEKDEMRLLTTLFNINAIPRYILVDKDGEVVNQQFSISSGMDEVLEKYGIE